MSDKLPQAEGAHVEPVKLTKYLLSIDHPRGKAKAKFFMQFGFKTNHFIDLATSLKKHAATQPVIERKESPFGTKYVVQCKCESPDGRNPCIRSVWIIEETAPPRLVTAHPAPT